MLALLLAGMLAAAQAQDPLTLYPTLSEMLAFMPRQAPSRCDSIRYSPADPVGWRATSDFWSWSATSPGQLTETLSGTTFPHPDYPTVNRTVVSAAGLNTTLTYTTGSTGFQTRSRRCVGRSPDQFCEPAYTEGVWLQGCLSDFQADYFSRSIVNQLVSRYDGTSATESYAMRLVELLDAWAEVWPYYVFRVTNTIVVMNPDDCVRYGPIGSGSVCCCSLFSHYNGQAHELDRVPTAAYERIRTSTSAAQLSATRGYDVLARIRRNILRREADYFERSEGTPLYTLMLSNLLSWTAPFLAIAGTLQRDDACRP